MPNSPLRAGAKILALQFKNLGDTVMMVPALRALHDQVPGCAVHVLVREEAGPLLANLPWLARVWTLPRVRGRSQFRTSWPVIRQLRAARFDCSIDFAANDRTAILSFLCGARHRLGAATSDGFFGRRFCFTETQTPAPY